MKETNELRFDKLHSRKDAYYQRRLLFATYYPLTPHRLCSFEREVPL